MTHLLTAVVIGAGMAGEGHTVALQYAGVDVLAICSRTESVVSEVAGRLGVKTASTDWRRTVGDLRPDIVSVATPALAHVDQVTAALELGCHVLSDKPLATSAADAGHLYELARRAQVKTALAATWRYSPGVLYLAEVVASGAVGRPLSVSSDGLIPWPHPAAATWMNRYAQGGGLLNNRLPHQLTAVQRVVGGEPLQVMGEARVRRARLPNLGHLHDYRERRRLLPEEVAGVDWETVDGDDDALALVRLGQPGAGPEETVTARIYCSAVVEAEEERILTILGDAGAIKYVELRKSSVPDGRPREHFVARLNRSTSEWEREEVPARIYADLPRLDNELHRDWAALALDFVADIKGEAHPAYPTFREGWVIQQVVEAIRSDRGWVKIEQP